MRVGRGHHVYDWIEKWARIPDSQSARDGWAHHGIVVSETGKVITFHQEDPTVLIFDELVCYLGENHGAFKLNPGWPNVPHETLIPGKCSSPHGIAADPDGNIYSAEWLIGGRINKLAKVVPGEDLGALDRALRERRRLRQRHSG